MTTITPQGIEVTPETVDDLAQLVAHAQSSPSTTGYHRSLMETAHAMATRLRAKHAGDATALARIDELTTA
jgi:hypothetical protein